MPPKYGAPSSDNAPRFIKKSKAKKSASHPLPTKLQGRKTCRLICASTLSSGGSRAHTSSDGGGEAHPPEDYFLHLTTPSTQFIKTSVFFSATSGGYVGLHDANTLQRIDCTRGGGNEGGFSSCPPHHGNNSPITGISCLNGGSPHLLVSSAYSGIVLLWDFRVRGKHNHIEAYCQEQPITDIASNSNGYAIAAGTEEGNIIVLDARKVSSSATSSYITSRWGISGYKALSAGTANFPASSSRKNPTGNMISPASNHFSSLSSSNSRRENALSTIAKASSAVVDIYETHSDRINSVNFHNTQNSLLLSGGEDGVLTLTDLAKTGRGRHLFSSEKSGVGGEDCGDGWKAMNEGCSVAASSTWYTGGDVGSISMKKGGKKAHTPKRSRKTSDDEDEDKDEEEEEADDEEDGIVVSINTEELVRSAFFTGPHYSRICSISTVDSVSLWNLNSRLGRPAFAPPLKKARKSAFGDDFRTLFYEEEEDEGDKEEDMCYSIEKLASYDTIRRSSLLCVESSAAYVIKGFYVSQSDQLFFVAGSVCGRLLLYEAILGDLKEVAEFSHDTHSKGVALGHSSVVRCCTILDCIDGDPVVLTGGEDGRVCSWKLFGIHDSVCTSAAYSENLPTLTCDKTIQSTLSTIVKYSRDEEDEEVPLLLRARNKRGKLKGQERKHHFPY